MSYTLESISPEDAKRMLAAGEAIAGEIGIASNIAIVDAGGHLVAFTRQDGALIGSIDLAIDKAVTSRLFDKSTAELATLAQSGRPLFGIQESNVRKVIIFGGGIPLFIAGRIAGAVGASAGTVEQDIAESGNCCFLAATKPRRKASSFIHVHYELPPESFQKHGITRDGTNRFQEVVQKNCTRRKAHVKRKRSSHPLQRHPHRRARCQTRYRSRQGGCRRDFYKSKILGEKR